MKRELISVEEAESLVDDIVDGNGKGVDEHIFPILVPFIRICEYMGFETFSSCEGHLDWGFPFPRITFRVPCPMPYKPAWWRFWEYPRFLRRLRHYKHHLKLAEQKTEQLAAIFTRLLINFYRGKAIPTEHTFFVFHPDGLVFRLMPVHVCFNLSVRASGDLDELHTLLVEQRAVMLAFAEYCVEVIGSQEHIAGIPEDGCRGCMGRT